DRQTARPAVAAAHLDAPQEDQLAGLRVEDVDAPHRGAGVILGDRQVEEALLRIPDRLLDAAARCREPASRWWLPDVVIRVEELVDDGRRARGLDQAEESVEVVGDQQEVVPRVERHLVRAELASGVEAAAG